MQRATARALVLTGALTFLSVSAPAREVAIPHANLTLTGDLALAEGKTPADGVVLIVHGTLAHGRMEITRTFQDLLRERGLSSLAITLSYGIDRRQGMYDCQVPHRHTQADAVAEVGAWVAWLKGEGAKRVVLLGHSRGGNQVAWYATEQPDPAVAGLVLMAPPEVDAVELAASYRKTFEREPGPVLEQAQALAAKGQGGELMSPVGILYCPDTSATADALLSYHAFDPRMDTPTLAERLTVPTLVVVAGADDITPGLDEAFAPAAKAGKVRILVIDGADHFFRDLYAEEAADVIAEFIDTL